MERVLVSENKSVLDANISLFVIDSFDSVCCVDDRSSIDVVYSVDVLSDAVSSVNVPVNLDSVDENSVRDEVSPLISLFPEVSLPLVLI